MSIIEHGQQNFIVRNCLIASYEKGKWRTEVNKSIIFNPPPAAIVLSTVQASAGQVQWAVVPTAGHGKKLLIDNYCSKEYCLLNI